MLITAKCAVDNAKGRRPIKGFLFWTGRGAPWRRMGNFTSVHIKILLAFNKV